MLEIAAVAVLAGFVQGLSGFAFALVCTSLWAWMMEPQMLVPTAILASFIAQFASLRWIRPGLQVRRVAPFVVGGLVGVPIGAAILPLIDVMAFRLVVGIALMLFSTVMLRAKRLPTVSAGGRPADLAIGALSGLIGGASGLSGPPLIIWCMMRGWSKLVQRATMQAFFVTTQVLTIALFAWHGLITLAVLKTVALLAPLALGSAWLGVKVAARLDEALVRIIVLSLLWLSGAALVVPRLWAALA
ncbi:MAG: sulfite exporter TauE/SafE family protein [Burkholderiaceae bacterium]